MNVWLLKGSTVRESQLLSQLYWVFRVFQGVNGLVLVPLILIDLGQTLWRSSNLP